MLLLSLLLLFLFLSLSLRGGVCDLAWFRLVGPFGDSRPVRIVHVELERVCRHQQGHYAEVELAASPEKRPGQVQLGNLCVCVCVCARASARVCIVSALCCFFAPRVKREPFYIF